MRSVTRGFLEVAEIGRCVDKPTDFSPLLLTSVYAMMMLMYEHTHIIYTRGVWRYGRGIITQIS